MQNFWHDLPRPFFILAPMEAVTDVVFRHVVQEAAAPDIFFTEFTNATGWVHAGDKAIRGRLIKTDDENPIVAQIWGGEVGDMAQLAAHCRELGYHGIDINMGCPAKSAIKSGGSALIRNPQLAAEAIAAAKTAGLPVSVKTRLGYTHVDEWRDWLTHLLQQDIVNLTIHLRTKKEMSKVPAHFELIPDIVALRDDIAPHTLLTINGDITDRAHGEELVAQYGVDGIMIGRGIFHNPFVFSSRAEASVTPLATEALRSPRMSEEASLSGEDCLSLASSAATKEGDSRMTRRAEAALEKDGVMTKGNGRKKELLDLLNFHLDLYDHWQPQLQRPFETLKRFFKIYIRDFDGASDLRNQLMHTTTTDEVREIIKKAA